MRVPDPPAIKRLRHLSPSLYEAARICNARAAWIAFGDRDNVPHDPRALLGTCVHALMEEAHNARLPVDGEESRQLVAREIFDRRAKALHESAHPLLRAKFPTVDKVPYYYLYRERAVLLALAIRPNTGRAADSAPMQRSQAHVVERTLTSRDGLLVGRPDHIDTAAREVVEYKTGAAPDGDPEGLRDSEVRQLRLYVHLARELGLDVPKGAVVRIDGTRIELEVSERDAVLEAQQAKQTLGTFNSRATEGFNRIAEPSPDACRHCPCIPFCEAFWESATPMWADRCGIHVEGTVTGVTKAVLHNTALLTLEVAVKRGTTDPCAAVVQQLPESWVRVDGSPSPTTGDLIRVVNCRLAADAGYPALIRPDRLTTAVWTVPQATTASPQQRNGERNAASRNG